MGKDKPWTIKQQKKQERGKKANNPNHGDGRNGEAAAAATVGNGTGCICPTGCLVGKEITINEALGVGGGNANGNKLVKVFCSNATSGKCKAVPLMHEVCFEKWEKQLLVQLRMRQFTRDWNDDKLKRHLWVNDGTDYCFRTRKCTCGGFITRVDPEDVEQPKPTEKAEKNAKKAADPESYQKKQLPALVTVKARMGGTSMYKTCPGYSAHGVAANYCSNDYRERANRARIRQQRELQERQEKEKSVPSYPVGYQPPPKRDDDNDWWMVGLDQWEDRHKSRTTSLSSSTEESNLFGLGMPDNIGWTKVGPGRRWNATRRAVPDLESDDDAIITDEDLIKEIKDLLGSLGGQLELDDPTLTQIVGARASGDLMMAICDAGGLGPWLSTFPDFNVDNGRVRLCRNVKREPARMNTTGSIMEKTESRGIIQCPAYDCTVYFDDDLDGFDDLLERDIVKFEAQECRQQIDGHRWKASSVILLQRSNQPLMTGFRRSAEEFKAKAAAAKPHLNLGAQVNHPAPILNPQPAHRSLFNVGNGSSVGGNPVIYHRPLGIKPENHYWSRMLEENFGAENGADLLANGNDDDEPKCEPDESFWAPEMKKTEEKITPINIAARSPVKEEINNTSNGGLNSSMDFEEMVQKLTADYSVSSRAGHGSGYGDVLAMLKSWDVCEGNE